MNSITLTISSGTVGFGHLKRMRIFKEYLKKKKLKILFFILEKKTCMMTQIIKKLFFL